VVVAAEVVLAARGLTAAPPGAPAGAEGVDLEVRRGEWVAITGANGSGKTTLALALAGLLPRRAGALALEGAPLEAGSPGRARIAVVLQEPGLQLTQDNVRDEIAFGAMNLGAADADARRDGERMARRLGLGDELERRPTELSAGRQQMVLLAAALAARPALLVADEACAHVDAAGRERALDEVRAAARDGVAVVWVTQEPAELRRADRGYEMSGGRLRELDPMTKPAPGEGRAVAQAITASARSSGDVLVRVLIPPDLELAIPTTGIVALTGPNGAGKTTVLESLAGVSERLGVAVRWGSAPPAPPLLVGELPERQIFAERVADEIAHAAVARGRPRSAVLEEALRHLAVLGLGPEFLERRTWSLSSGEKRLVLTVGGLVAPAGLLLLDEPTCGLDPGRREALGILVRSHATRGPVLLATQDLEWLRHLAEASADGSRDPLRTFRLEGSGTFHNSPSPGKKTD
jgi:energy-coupling factor transporter ATP-binding protein EcfA2